MHEVGKKSSGPTSGQARRAARIGHPELSIECPQCNATVGRTCFMKPGLMGVTHTVRKIVYQQRIAALPTAPDTTHSS